MLVRAFACLLVCWLVGLLGCLFDGLLPFLRVHSLACLFARAFVRLFVSCLLAWLLLSACLFLCSCACVLVCLLVWRRSLA